MARKRSRKLRRNPSVGDLFSKGESTISTAERSVARVGGAASRAKSVTQTDVLKYALGFGLVLAVGGAAWYFTRPASTPLRLG